MRLYAAGMYLEVQRDEREHETFEVLHEVVEHFESFGVLAVLHVQQRADLCALVFTSVSHMSSASSDLSAV